MAANQRDDQRRSQVQEKVNPNRIRHRVTMSAYGSARRRLWAQVNVSSVAEVRRPDFVNRSRRHRVAALQVKHAAEGKEHRAHMANRLSRQPEEPVKRAVEEKEDKARRLSRNSSSSSEAARLPQPITASDRVSRKVGRRDHQKKRHRQGSNNFGAITPAAPERKNSGAAFITRRCRGV